MVRSRGSLDGWKLETLRFSFGCASKYMEPEDAMRARLQARAHPAVPTPSLIPRIQAEPNLNDPEFTFLSIHAPSRYMRVHKTDAKPYALSKGKSFHLPSFRQGQ